MDIFLAVVVGVVGILLFVHCKGRADRALSCKARADFKLAGYYALFFPVLALCFLAQKIF